MKFLKSLSKFFIITTGTISLGVLMGIGIAGNVYKQDVINTYNSVHNAMIDENNKDIFTNINTEIDKLQGTVDSAVTDINNQIQKSKTSLQSLDSLISELEKQANGSNGNTKLIAAFNSKAGTEDIKQTVENLRKTYDTVNKTITDAETFINENTDTFEQMFQEGGFVYNLKNTMNDVQGYYDQLTNFFVQNPPDSFEATYSQTVDLLTIIPAVILGVGLIGTILTFVFYKSVDGRMVRRSSVEKDLTSHVKYLIKKYPRIKENIKDDIN